MARGRWGRSCHGGNWMDWSAYLEFKLGQLFPEPMQRATAEVELNWMPGGAG